ncbi:MAG: glycosyltransferase [Bacteroidetes bacterium]|nr:glycosyltransferase [Bacteroidota bacterium]
MINNPVVSVLMTVYNREKYLAEAIESVLTSSYQDFELIIVDDGSTDNSKEIAKHYITKDSRIRFFENKSNLGQFSNRNYIATLAIGKYIKYLDSDDILYPHGLELMVKSMEQFPEAKIGMSTRSVHSKLPLYLSARDSYIQHYFNKSILHFGPSATILRRETFEEFKGFNEKYGVLADQILNLEFAAIYGVVLFYDDLIWWRRHSDQEYNLRQAEYRLMNHTGNLDVLKSENCPLDKKSSDLAIQNQYVRDSRTIFILFLKGHPLEALKTSRLFKIKLKFILLSLMPNKMRRFFTF